MKLTFDPNTDAAFLFLGSASGGAPRSERFDVGIEGVQVFLFYSSDDRLVGIEVLGASRFLASDVLIKASLD